MFSTSAFADYEADLQSQCLGKNTNRVAWDWIITQDVPAVGQGIVQSWEISRTVLPDNSVQIGYGNCVQVDCLQEPFVTDPLPLYCENKQLKTSFYETEFVFPECKASYNQQYGTVDNSSCVLCPEPQVLTGFSQSSCVDSKAVYSRSVKAFIANFDEKGSFLGCTERKVVEYKVSNDACFGVPGLTMTPVLVIILLFIVGILYYYRKEVKKKFM